MGVVVKSDGRFDPIDCKLLEILQEKGRAKRNELAEMTGLSLPSVGERLKKLEEAGIIIGYHAIVDPRKFGLDVMAFIAVTVDSSRHYHAFLERVSVTPEILECHAITGDGTHLLKVRVLHTTALEKLLAKVQSWSGVIRTETRVVLSSPKEILKIQIPNEKKES